MSSASEIPRVGIGVFIIDRATQAFIMGKRLGAHGAGTWALPGGHLEHGESFEDCSRREIREETGLEVVNLKFLTATNTVGLDGGKHYVTIFMVAERQDGDREPGLLEPDKCEGWHWVSWDEFLGWTILGGNRGVHDERVVLFQPMLSLAFQRPGIDPFACEW